MKDLAYYKGQYQLLKGTLKHCKNRGAKQERIRAMIFCRRRIVQIERAAKILVMLFIALTILITSGCATLSGFGEDVQNVSEGYRQQTAAKYK